mgnify:CR=1 FL=1
MRDYSRVYSCIHSLEIKKQKDGSRLIDVCFTDRKKSMVQVASDCPKSELEKVYEFAINGLVREWEKANGIESTPKPKPEPTELEQIKALLEEIRENTHKSWI